MHLSTSYHLSQVSSAASKTYPTETSQYSSPCQIFSNEAHEIDALSTGRTELFGTENHGDCDSAHLNTVGQESDSYVNQDQVDDLNILSPKSTSTSPRSEYSLPEQLEGMDPLFGTKIFDQDYSPDFIRRNSGDYEFSRFETADTEHKPPPYQACGVPIGQEHFDTSVQEELKGTIPDSDKSRETNLSLILESDQESPSIPYPEPAQVLCEVKEPSLDPIIPSGIFQSDLNNENKSEPSATDFLREHETKKGLETSEERFIDLPEGSETDLHLDAKEFDDESITSASATNENMPTSYSKNQQLDFTEEFLLKPTQNEDFSSYSDVTPETVKDARNFIFEEFMPAELNESHSNNERPKPHEEDSEDHLNVNSRCFASQGMTSSTSEEDGCITSQCAETGSTSTISSYIPPTHLKGVLSGFESPANECSDQEPYFDCEQAESDFSETEPDQSDPKVNCSGSAPLIQNSNPTGHQKINKKILLSSGSEDFEDAYIVHEPLSNVDEDEEELLHHSESSEDEFTFCEASQPPALCSESNDTDKYLTRVR